MKKPPVRETTPLFGSLRYWQRERAKLLDKDELTPLERVRLKNCNDAISNYKNQSNDNSSNTV